jgi:DNA integrity scanning protein DisA with diadenylate cyclase activity
MRPDPVFERSRSTSDWCRRDVLEATLDLAIAIAREGREGRRVGALFTLGHADAVLACSRALILDPLAGHALELHTSPIPTCAARSRSWRS